MVGIVVVSHSRALARAAVGLAAEMLHGRTVPIAIAAGLDETTLGTDAVRVKDAIEEVDSSDGVLVLMDLGSAVLSAELALDLLAPDVAGRVRLCAAPLVEGLVVATVAAAGGAPLTEVASEASGALAGKQSHLQAPEHVAVDADAVINVDARGEFDVLNVHGLHARPAARLVSEVRTLDARVWLRNLTTGSASVPATSLSRVATLGALAGHRLEVAASGSQSREAVEHVTALAAREFDEVRAVLLDSGAAGSSIGPMGASPGVAVGPAWSPVPPEQPNGLTSAAASHNPIDEWRRLRVAVASVRRETMRTRAETARRVGDAEAAIFDAHLMLLDDTDLLDRIRSLIDQGRSAGAAWSQVLSGVAAEFEALGDEYQRARAADVTSLRDQVLLTIEGRATAFVQHEGVLIAPDLTAAQAAALDGSVVAGVVLAYSSPTSHSAILARARGIPAIVGAGPAVLSTAHGTIVALDGGTGDLAINPDPETLVEFKNRAAERERRADEARAVASNPACTRDGVSIEVAANIGSVADAHVAAAHGADSAGLVRTEFLFLGRDSAPTVAEQEAAYRELVAAIGGRRLVIRTFDVGGDKPLPYVDLPVEANPFLGLRGIRLALARPDLLRDQLVAISRVAADAAVSVMFPMVSSASELVAARRLLVEAASIAGLTGSTELKVGAMVEVPAAALNASTLVPYVDFLSIGTNDLTQYTFAADRGNDAVAGLANALDPAVLRLVDFVCRAADGHVPVAVCGEVASDPAAVPVLLGLGVRELSVTPYAVPLVKQAVRELDLAECSSRAAAAL